MDRRNARRGLQAAGGTGTGRWRAATSDPKKAMPAEIPPAASKVSGSAFSWTIATPPRVPKKAAPAEIPASTAASLYPWFPFVLSPPLA